MDDLTDFNFDNFYRSQKFQHLVDIQSIQRPSLYFNLSVTPLVKQVKNCYVV